MKNHWMAIVSLVLCLAGCAASNETAENGNEAPQPQSRGQSAELRGHDPCSLLDPKEVEAVIGPLAGPPFRTREASDDNAPTDDGDACVYETANYQNIRLSVTWEDGAMALKAVSLPGRLLGAVPGNAPGKDAVARNLLPGGVQLAGEWDEATSFGCCQVFALRGDTLVTFDFRGWKNDMRTAAGVLDKALVRLDRPLAIEGRAGNAAAAAHAARRPAERDACSVLARAEVEAILGPLLDSPKLNGDDKTTCLYRFTQAASEDSPLKDAPAGFTGLLSGLTGGKTGLVAGPVDVGLTIRWRGGFRWLHEGLQIGGAVMGPYEGMPGMPKRETGPVAGPWTESAQTSLAFTAVKNDVAVSVSTEPMLTSKQVEVRRRLVAAAIGKI